ncbi:MAG: NUDIX hydrolase [Myxococcota bacterium]|nr:NUDIX hydrolase [Myxococcota bacterium]
MSKPEIWPLLEEETLQDCRIFNVVRARARSPRTGRPHDFYRIESVDWVNVVPLTPDDQVVMVRQFRHGSREVTLEIPGGMVDPGEEPAAAAARELLEETGYRAGDVVSLGRVSPNPALFDNRVHTFLATACTRVAEIANEGAEETRVELLARGELLERVRAGDVDHALVIAGLYWWELARGLPGARQDGGER